MICGSKLTYQEKNDCIQRKHSTRLTKKKNPRVENRETREKKIKIKTEINDKGNKTNKTGINHE